MILEDHMLLPSRKVLAARLVQIEAALPLEEDGAHAQIPYRELDRKLVQFFEQESLKPKKDSRLKNNTVRLDESLDYFVKRLSGSAKADLTDHPKLFNTLKRALKTEAGRMACDACSKLAPIVCNGGKFDVRILNDGGACVKSLREMFEVAHTVARHYYTTYGSLPLGNAQVVFDTKYENDKPHDFPIEIYVGGLTVFDDSPSQTLARVVLVIPAEHFDTAAYLSSLYVLFHECFAHVFQDITPKLPERDEVLPEDSDRFTEGWMDWVAYEVFEQVLKGAGLVSLSSMRFIGSKLDHGIDFHRARVKTTGPQVSKDAGRRDVGREAARRVYEVFKNRLEPDPWRRFLQLSFDLNVMSDFNLYDREDFVTALRFLEENDHQAEPSVRHNILAGEITKYLKHNDIREFIDSVLRLKKKWVPQRSLI